ncbi:MAG: TldD/PmbA family protein [Bacillota bacterium]
MIGRERALSLLEQALEASQADQTEIRLTGADLSLTRFAQSVIHQNLSRRNYELSVRVIRGKRVGSAVTNRLDPASIKDAVNQAMAFTTYAEEDPDFVSLPGPAQYAEVDNYCPATAGYTAEERARDVGTIVERADREGFAAFGSHTIEQTEIAVANSLGVRAYTASASAYLRTVISQGDTSGYADYYDRDVSQIDVAALADEAVSRCAAARGAGPVEPGVYEAIFLPYAVADIIRFPAYIGWNGLAVQEGRSFMAGKFGQKLVGENITIWDDGLDPRGLATPFDAEGVPKQRVSIINRGVAEGVVYDTYSANLEGKESTGHAYTSRWGRGASPSNMVMAGGDSSVEEMIASTKRGILVTRFHYTHCPDPRRVVMTGTTRDGTFLIEDGKIVRPVFNLRIEASVLDLLSDVELISRETKLSRDWWGSFVSVLPAIKVRQCHFSSGTDF